VFEISNRSVFRDIGISILVTPSSRSCLTTSLEAQLSVHPEKTSTFCLLALALPDKIDGFNLQTRNIRHGANLCSQMFEVSEKQGFRLEQQKGSESGKSDDFIPSRSCVETKLKVERFLSDQPSPNEIVQPTVKVDKVSFLSDSTPAPICAASPVQMLSSCLGTKSRCSYLFEPLIRFNWQLIIGQVGIPNRCMVLVRASVRVRQKELSQAVRRASRYQDPQPLSVKS
jgi:hypothetical protein